MVESRFKVICATDALLLTICTRLRVRGIDFRVEEDPSENALYLAEEEPGRTIAERFGAKVVPYVPYSPEDGDGTVDPDDLPMDELVDGLIADLDEEKYGEE